MHLASANRELPGIHFHPACSSSDPLFGVQMAQLSAIYAQTKRITSPVNEIPHWEKETWGQGR